MVAVVVVSEHVRTYLAQWWNMAWHGLHDLWFNDHDQIKSRGTANRLVSMLNLASLVR